MEFNFTKSQLEVLQKLVEYPDDFKYPLGTIIASDDIHAVDNIGGQWDQIKDAFLWGSGDVKSITYLDENGVSVTKSLVPGATGGEINHKLTVNEMPKHSHAASFTFNHSGNWHVGMIAQGDSSTSISSRDNVVGYRGDDQPHNNMPPYMAKYMWIKTKLQSELEGENVW